MRLSQSSKGSQRCSEVYNNQNQTRLMKLNEKKSESLSVLFTSLNSKILKIPKNIHHFRSIFFINNNNNKKKKKEKEKDHSPLLVLPDAAPNISFQPIYKKEKKKKLKEKKLSPSTDSPTLPSQLQKPNTTLPL